MKFERAFLKHRFSALVFALFAVFALSLFSPRADASEFDDVKRAAEGGAVLSQYMLAQMYENGEGTSQNLAEAAVWYGRAADGGSAMARNRLGEMYRDGIGVSKDENKAAQLFEQAAKSGYAPARDNLAALTGTAAPQAAQSPAPSEKALGASGFLERGVGALKANNYAEAAEWFKKAADQGLANAQFNLGVAYLFGNGVPRDYGQAAEWFRKAADQGYASAQYNLGLMYDNGDGVPRDYGQAASWYRKAADQGDIDAQNNLGTMYMLGYGVSKDLQRAIEYFRLAAKGGDEMAIKNLSELGVEFDRSQQTSSQPQSNAPRIDIIFARAEMILQ